MSVSINLYSSTALRRPPDLLRCDICMESSQLLNGAWQQLLDSIDRSSLPGPDNLSALLARMECNQ